MWSAAHVSVRQSSMQMRTLRSAEKNTTNNHGVADCIAPRKTAYGNGKLTETVLKHEAVQHIHKAIMVARIWPTGPITV